MKQRDLFADPPAPATQKAPKQVTPPATVEVARPAVAQVATARVEDARVEGAQAAASEWAPSAQVVSATTQQSASVQRPAAAPGDAPTPAWRRRGAERTVWSVSQLTAQIKDLLEPSLMRVAVRGEVTGFRGPNVRGHLYFSVKDRFAVIEVRLWQSTAKTLTFALRDGLSVVVEGNVEIYEPQGRYSLIAQRIEPEGVGARALAFEQLKAKLSAEGLIGPNRSRPKRALPVRPRRVGVATSVSGAALRDFVKVLHRRDPSVRVVVCDTRVQGEGAAHDVARAIRWLSLADIDVLVVTRGGGSVDDLWAFNEEPVARAIFQCPVPVVSAVGHEIDTTLADLVADVRAPTPSAAAEVVAPVVAELREALAVARGRLRRALERRMNEARQNLRSLQSALADPRRTLDRQRLVLNDAAERLARAWRSQRRDDVAQLRALSQRLQRARPQAQVEQRREALVGLKKRLHAAGVRTVREARSELTQTAHGLQRQTPKTRLATARAQLAATSARLLAWAPRHQQRERERLLALVARLDALSPLQVLARGYAVARRGDGRVVRRGADVQPGDDVEVMVGDRARISARVSAVRQGEENN